MRKICAPLTSEHIAPPQIKTVHENRWWDQRKYEIHGHAFKVTATDGGRMPPAGRWPETTVLVPVGATRDVEFIADAPGDWALHCHKSHHTMNPMGHTVPNTLGVSQKGLEEKIRKQIPGYMTMGETGMAEMQSMSQHMSGPQNTLPMMMGNGDSIRLTIAAERNTSQP